MFDYLTQVDVIVVKVSDPLAPQLQVHTVLPLTDSILILYLILQNLLSDWDTGQQ